MFKVESFKNKFNNTLENIDCKTYLLGYNK